MDTFMDQPTNVDYLLLGGKLDCRAISNREWSEAFERLMPRIRESLKYCTGWWQTRDHVRRGQPSRWYFTKEHQLRYIQEHRLRVQHLAVIPRLDPEIDTGMLLVQDGRILVYSTWETRETLYVDWLGPKTYSSKFWNIATGPYCVGSDALYQLTAIVESSITERDKRTATLRYALDGTLSPVLSRIKHTF